MSPTTKVILVGGTGAVAVYLLWRLWPTREKTAPVHEEAIPIPGRTPIRKESNLQEQETKQSLPGASYLPPNAADSYRSSYAAPANAVPIATASMAMPTCPPGTYWNDKRGQCVAR